MAQRLQESAKRGFPLQSRWLDSILEVINDGGDVVVAGMAVARLTAPAGSDAVPVLTAATNRDDHAQSTPFP